MGKKDSPSPPPLPPDYTQQRQGAVNTTNQTRGREAEAYNERVGFFNNQLSGFGSNVDSLGDTINGMSIGSDWSNYDTLTGQLDDYQDQISGFLNNDFSGWQAWEQPDAPSASPAPTTIDYGNIDYGNFDSRGGGNPYSAMGSTAGTIPVAADFVWGGPPASSGSSLQYDAYGFPIAPNWSPTGTEYGESVFYDSPTLSQLNRGQATNFQNELKQLQTTLSGLNTQRTSEQNRGNDFFTNIINQANEGDETIAGLSLNSNFDQYLTQARQVRRQAEGFNSVLDFTDNRTSAMSEIDEFEQLLRDRMGLKEEEQGRVTDFMTSVGGAAQALRNSMRTMGIGDIGDPNDFYSQLDALTGQLSGFDSELDTDFSNERNLLYDAEANFDRLRSNRSSEEARLQQLKNSFANRATSLSNRAGRADIYNGYGIDDLNDQFDMFRQEIGGVNSELSFDFNDILGQLDEGSGLLGEVRTRRDTALQAEMGDVETLLGGLGDISEYDEGSLKGLQSRLQREATDLQKYGGGTSANTLAIEDAMRQVDDRLDAVATGRRGIENDAISLMQQIRNGEFRNLNEVTAFKDPFSELRNRSERWGATQAQDELAIIEQLLRDGKSLVDGFQTNVDDRTSREQADVKGVMDAYGNLKFPTVAGGRLQSEEQLRSFLALMNEDEEGYYNLSDNSAFARGVIGR